MAALVDSHYRNGNYSSVTVSIGCGNCDMEIQSSSLCICLDINKRSLFCARLRSRTYKKTNIIVQVFNWKEDLLDLLYHLSCYRFPEINILYQHPSPNENYDYRESLSQAGMNCLLSLKLGRIHGLYIVFDSISGRHCWKTNTLEECFTKYWCEEIKVTTSTISVASDNALQHPIFGIVARNGWSKHKSASDILCMKIELPTHN